MHPYSLTSLAVEGDAESLADRACRRIRDEILRGHLPLGSVISRRKMAVSLGMSVLPVSEALQRLETDGLVESRPRAGTRVRIPEAQYIRDSFIVREALESQSARLFAERATLRERQEILRMADRVDALFSRCVSGEHNDTEKLFEAHSYHFRFHMTIAESGHCPGLCAAIEKQQVLIWNWLFDVAALHRSVPRRSHRELAEALASGQAPVADAAMRTHIQYGLDELILRIPDREAPNWREHRRSSAGATEAGS